MKYVIGFFMAWGNFLALPCPYKRWDRSLKNVMLVFLPMIGILIGALWIPVTYLSAKYISVPLICGFVMTVYIFAICGFIHLDGFMDCNDAILSRRSLEEKQRILKDSRVGAFAAVSLVMLMLGWLSVGTTSFLVMDLKYLILIPFLSRIMAALFVLSYEPMEQSQYREDKSDKNRMACRIAVIVQLVIITAALGFLSDGFLVYYGRVAIELVTGFLACAYGRRQLGGMSGDVAGYTICISEFAGICALTLIR